LWCVAPDGDAAHLELVGEFPVRARRPTAPASRSSSAPELFTVAEVERTCPGVKRPTTKLAMKRLREAGEIICIRPGKYALWKKAGATQG